MITNNVTRLLDKNHVSYIAHELPQEKLSAEETSLLLGVELHQVYKTIVLKREGKGKTILAVVPGNTEVDLKSIARFLGEKKVLLSTQREAETITGLQAGGISPLALLNKGFQVILDQSCRQSNFFYISGGQRGLSIELSVDAFINLTGAQLANITRTGQ
jgi:Cys-tRNA(Pro)/Cys-tRNA(Cys) deacylase